VGTLVTHPRWLHGSQPGPHRPPFLLHTLPNPPRPQESQGSHTGFVLATWLGEEGAALIDKEWRPKAQGVLDAREAKRLADAERRRFHETPQLRMSGVWSHCGPPISFPPPPPSPLPPPPSPRFHPLFLPAFSQS
jgi:hypothetical protein